MKNMNMMIVFIAVSLLSKRLYFKESGGAGNQSEISLTPG